MSAIISTIETAMQHFEDMGTLGEVGRLARSKGLTFESRSYSPTLDTFQGVIVGRDGTEYNPHIHIGHGWTCDCQDHKNQNNGTRPKGKDTGENYMVSPCKHTLALARQGWVAMRDLKAKVEVVTEIETALSNKEVKRKSA
tara:strand:- start:72 stop:494 length:423 start_codon:yes stop_codon:yes gene_type:complete